LSPDPASRTADQALDAYAAQAAHQLGEAVALMRASTTVLERQGPARGDARDALRGMSAGIDRAQRFVDDLLDLAAVGRSEALPEPVDLVAVVDAVRGELDEPLRRAGATLACDAPSTVVADRRQLRRLLTHCARTAVAAGATAIAVAAHERDGTAVVEVRDDGAAPDAEAGDPFAPFAKARGRGPLVGAGLSMTLCRRIAELHGGAIGIAASDAGTVVTVTLAPEA
jgi:signal transduction histidine kinase